LFKERLFVYLSRFCAVRYCIVRHVGFLIGAGRPAGDALAPPETIEQVIALLSRPARGAMELEQAIARLEALTAPVNIPAPRTALESDLFDALTIIFLEPRMSERARNVVRRGFGEQTFETLTAYLAFIRTAHYWTETHPELAYEPDIAAVMRCHPDLAALLLDQTEAKRVAEGEALRQTLAELKQAKHVLSQNETIQVFLHKLSDALRPLGDALEILRVACRVLREHLGASRVLYAEATGHEDLYETAFDAEDNAHPMRYRIADFGTKLASDLRAGKPAWRNDVPGNPHLSLAERSAVYAIGGRTSANAPLIKNGNLVAMLGVHWKDTHAWSTTELELLREVADRIWVATERARARAALRESEERLRLAQLRTGIGIWDSDLRTGRMTWTPELGAIFGVEPGAVTSYADFRKRVHPDDISAVEANRDAAIRRRDTFSNEFRIIRPDGQIRWILSMGGAFYDEVTGEPIRILGNNVDITDRKQTEARLSDALEAGQVVAFEWDAANRRSQRSDNAERILGVVKDSHFLRQVHPDDRARFKADLAALSPDKPSYALTFRFMRSDGRLVWLEETAKGEFDSATKLSRIKGLTRDITERKRAEQALADRDVQLALAGRAGLVGTYAYDTDYDADGEKAQISSGYAAIHGLPEGTTEISRNAWLARVHPEDAERLQALRDQAFHQRQRDYKVDYRIVSRWRGAVDRIAHLHFI
jgi:PAS domain S-box-containing protein